MANITIRDLPDAAKDNLRIQAAYAGVSLEAYVRSILSDVAREHSTQNSDILDLAQRYFGAKNGIKLDIQNRSSKRGIADFYE